MNVRGGTPSGQWSMTWSSPGYFASYSRISAMQSAGEPTIQAFCSTPSRSRGARAGAPEELAGLTEFAQGLVAEGAQIYASGGSRRHLEGAGIPVRGRG